MKKVILAVMLLALSIKATSQVIDTTIKSVTAVKIQPIIVQATFAKKDTITHLGIEVISGVLTKSCTVRFILLANAKNVFVSENILIDGEDYTNWDSDLYPFVFVAARFGFAFKNN